MKQTLTLLVMLVLAALAGVNREWELAEQYRTLERLDLKPSRKAKIQAWLAEKRPMKPIPDVTQAPVSRKGLVSGDGLLLAVDEETGLPQWLSFDGGENLLANDACGCPLWELCLQVPGEEKFRRIGPYSCTVSFKKFTAPVGLVILYECREAAVTVRITKAEGPFARFAIEVENRIPQNRLDSIEFPKLALRPRGDVETNQCVIPWRRGRQRPLANYIYSQHEEYPCSSARFQMSAIYDAASRKGIYFAAEDGDGWEKHFLQTFIPAYGVMVKNLRFYPPERGLAGKGLKNSFTCILGTFSGDWYDAAQIYRAWFKKQVWASRGPLVTNDTADFLKHAPVWLRFYLRQSQGRFPASLLANFNAWRELFPNWKMPATLYHYSPFKEPENKPRYPVCEYYGFCAPPFPGLAEILRETTQRGLRTSVYWQSEIINQDAPENESLTPADKLDIAGNPVLYLNERGILCRQAPLWHARTAEAHEHLAKIGFTGFYLDTYGKSKPDTQCYDTRHGHAPGGSNQEFLAQRAYGKAVRRHIRAISPEFYMGGEASCECYVDLLDYKLNAVSTYPGHIPLERALYGDYILSHGRVVREKYTDDNIREIGYDFLEGNIPGRFFAPPPSDPAKRNYLKELVRLTEAAYDYMRTGRMLRSLEFGKPVAMMALTEPQKMETEEWRNTVYASYKDGSVGIAVFRFGVGDGENSLLLPPAEELGVPAGASVFRLHPDGTRALLGSLATMKEIPLKFPGNGFCVFVIR